MHLFEKEGADNTDKTLEIALVRSRELQIRYALVATTSGKTGLKAAELLKEMKVVVVTHSTGFAKPGVQEAEPSLIELVRELGASVLTATHAFGGAGRAVRKKFNTYQVDEIMAQTLRIFGQGTKVAVEIALMAADAGLAPIDEDVMAIGGTISGADTAVVLKPAHSQNLFDTKIREIVCKPYM